LVDCNADRSARPFGVCLTSRRPSRSHDGSADAVLRGGRRWLVERAEPVGDCGRPWWLWSEPPRAWASYIPGC